MTINELLTGDASVVADYLESENQISRFERIAATVNALRRIAALEDSLAALQENTKRNP